jgi:hypothetical protein
MFYKVLFPLCQFIRQYSCQIDSGSTKTLRLAQTVGSSVEILRNFSVLKTVHLYKFCIILLDGSATALFNTKISVSVKKNSHDL